MAFMPVTLTRCGTSSTTTGSTMKAGRPLPSTSSRAMSAPRFEAWSAPVPASRSSRMRSFTA